MITNLKALIVVLALAMAVFFVAKPICLRFMKEQDFVFRRNIWLALTVIGFLSPSFWLYAIAAFPLMIWAGQRDHNPLALYLLVLHVVPPIDMVIPGVIINQLFVLNNYRILAFAVLVPMAIKYFQQDDKLKLGRYKWFDAFIISYLVLQFVQFIPYEDVTNTMRRGIFLVIDWFLLYYVVSRYCIKREVLIESLAAFSLACALFVPIAVFESATSWLMYPGIGDVWGSPMDFSYLFRSDTLRSQASAGHSLLLGYLLAVAFGLWLFLSRSTTKRTVKVFAGLAIWAGLIAAYSRAPWIAAIIMLVIYYTMGANSVSRVFKIIFIGIPFIALLLLSPVGPRIIDNLPFVGTVDATNVDYRQRLAEASWRQIELNPFFGNVQFMENLEDLRQGQGIIDLVNVYATVAMLYGLIGLTLFITPFLMGMFETWKASRQSTFVDLELSRLGASLFACMLGTAFFLATCSLYMAVPYVFYLLCGLSVAYGQIYTIEKQIEKSKLKI